MEGEAELKDHKTLTMSKPSQSRFTKVQVSELKRKHQFRENYPLAEMLDEAEMWYDAVKEYENAPEIKEQRKLLEQTAKRADALRGVLGKLGTHELLAIGRVYSDLNLNQQIDQLHRLSRAADEALIAKKKPAPKKRKDTNAPLHGFIRALKRIFANGTGNPSKITQDGSGGKFYGSFFEFVEDCFRIMGIEKSNASTGTMIKRALKKKK